MPTKRFVAVVVVVAAMTFATVTMFGQAAQAVPGGASTQPKAASEQDIQMLREDIRGQRKQITAANVSLTPDEATRFWPIYDQYIQETIKINDTRWALIKDYAANYNTISDAQAQDYVKRSSDVDQQFLALRMKYVPIFSKAVSSKKAALWYQIDRRIDLMINLQLAAMIPVVDVNK